jgi:hypothetical protein
LESDLLLTEDWLKKEPILEQYPVACSCTN